MQELFYSVVLSLILRRSIKPFDYRTPFPIALFNQTAWRLVLNTYIRARRLVLWRGAVLSLFI